MTFRKVLILAIPLISCFAFAGCKKEDDAASGDVSQRMAGQKQSNDAVTSTAAAAPRADTGRGMAAAGGKFQAARLSTPPIPEAQVRQVIRKAELDVRVENVEKAEKAVGSIVQSVNGYTENAASTDLASTHPVLNLSLRVPVGSFDACIAKFEALGVRLSKTIGSEDVTGQLVDLEARLKTLRAQETVYRDMLKNRTQLEEVFSVQSQLTEVRTQIETIDGQRKTQAGLAAMSTIALTLEQNAIANVPSTDPNWLAQAWGEASSGASGAFRVAVVVLMWLVAFCPFWIPAVLILRRALKPALAKRTEIPPLRP